MKCFITAAIQSALLANDERKERLAIDLRDMSHHTGSRLSAALVNGNDIHPEVVVLHQFSKLRGYEKSFMRGGQHLLGNSRNVML